MAVGVESVEIRLWQPGDERVLPELANNRRIWRNLTNRFPHPYGHADAVEWIRSANRQPDDTRHFAVVSADRVVGAVGFERLKDLNTRTAEIGYWVGEPYWGSGIATRALELATECAFRDFDFVRLQAGVLGWNGASCRVLEKAGYSLEARLHDQGFKDGEVCDIVLYALLRKERPAA
jgi:RimJ/RimL family protein N-acetyltransferase